MSPARPMRPSPSFNRFAPVHVPSVSPPFAPVHVPSGWSADQIQTSGPCVVSTSVSWHFIPWENSKASTLMLQFSHPVPNQETADRSEQRGGHRRPGPTAPTGLWACTWPWGP